MADRNCKTCGQGMPDLPWGELDIEAKVERTRMELRRTRHDTARRHNTGALLPGNPPRPQPGSYF